MSGLEKPSSPFKHGIFQNLGLRKWLAKDDLSCDIQEPSQFDSSSSLRLLPEDFDPHSCPNDNIDIDQDNPNGDSLSQLCDEIYDSPRPPRFGNINIGLPRATTFKRQNSERRDRLLTSSPYDQHQRESSEDGHSDVPIPRSTSPLPLSPAGQPVPTLPFDDVVPQSSENIDEGYIPSHLELSPNTSSDPDQQPDLPSNSGSETGQNGQAPETLPHNILQQELDSKWILNLSMRFRDKSDREKFFVTFAETPNRWRKVTVSCDYRNAEPGSLEEDLKRLQYHRDKNAQIWESIRESVDEIQFFDTVTNLRLETLEGQLHVHVNEDVNEVITYPPISSVDYLNPMYIPETHLDFEAHLSGFVYRVKYNGKDYVKKEITGPETTEEFLYEVHALHALLDCENVIDFIGIVVDETGTLVKGLLIDVAEKGALADLFYDEKGNIKWERRVKWAKQVISGLADIHEAGFVQGDFTVSNVVVDINDDAKIIDINRRGCPIGWEPPEFIQKLENKQRISMYIGVKSDLYQLGMTLWAIAMEEDEPGRRPRPINIPPDADVPGYFREIIEICMSENPKHRLAAKDLLAKFPHVEVSHNAEDADAIEPQPAAAPPSGNDFGLLNQLHGDKVHASPLPISKSSQAFNQDQAIIPPSNSMDGLYYVDTDSDLPCHQEDNNNQVFFDDPYKITFPHCVKQDNTLVGIHSAPGITQMVRESSNHAADAISGLAVMGFQGTEHNPKSRSLDSASSATPVDLSIVPQDLNCIGTHPSVSLQGHFLSTTDFIPLEDLASEGDILHEAYLDDFTRSDPRMDGRLKASPKPPKPKRADVELLQSELPINPAFKDPAVSSMILSLRISHLISPDLQPEFTNDLMASILPINPAFKDQLPSDLMPLLHRQHRNSQFSSPNPQPVFANDLLTSTLPLNPAFKDTLPSDLIPLLPYQPQASQLSSPNSQPVSDNLMTSILPINPAFTDLLMPLLHYQGRPSQYISPQHDSQLSSYDDLLTSMLPINPTFRDPLSSNPLPVLHPCQPSQDILPSPNDSRDMFDDDLLTSILPINPPHRENTTEPMSDSRTLCMHSNGNLISSELPANPHQGDVQIGEATEVGISGPGPDKTPSSYSSPVALPRLEEYQDETNKSSPQKIEPEDDLFASQLPINPAYVNSGLLPEYNSTSSSNLPTLPTANPAPDYSYISDLFKSALPINPAVRS
ncbi:hypothetical protein FQN57_005966 [Myotisia sp. PD_48]|nr:hypothetical protein FQN57_005966 [Myotisia sp. PD_48]